MYLILSTYKYEILLQIESWLSLGSLFNEEHNVMALRIRVIILGPCHLIITISKYLKLLFVWHDQCATFAKTLLKINHSPEKTLYSKVYTLSSFYVIFRHLLGYNDYFVSRTSCALSFGPRTWSIYICILLIDGHGTSLWTGNSSNQRGVRLNSDT